MKPTNAPSTLSSSDLSRRVLRIHDHLYGNSAKRTPEAIAAEVVKVIRATMFLESGTRGPAFDLPPAAVRLLESADPTETARAATQLRAAFRSMCAAWDVYPESTTIDISDTDIAFVAANLSGLWCSDPNRDVLGDAVEVIRAQMVKRAGGQFFTDPRVTSLAVELLEFDPRNGDDLVDICAGTGGFLLAGLARIQQLLSGARSRSAAETRIVALAKHALRGQEVDADLQRIADATITARVSANGHRFVAHADSLAVGAFGPRNEAGIAFDRHLCAATNPPFGTKITIKDSAQLAQFELASISRTRSNTRVQKVAPTAPDVLFLEQNLRILQPGKGRLAIVTPYQLLSGPQAHAIREWLLRNAQVLAVVDLPAETFQPHTGTKTALVVVKRRAAPATLKETEKDPPVFMSCPRWIGHDRRGNPVFRKDPEGKESGEVLSDIEDVASAHRKFMNGGDPTSVHALSFTVPAARIARDPMLHLNAAYFRPTRQSECALDEGAWRIVKLGTLTDRVFYPGRFKRNYVASDHPSVPFLGGAEITELLISSHKRIGLDDPHLRELQVRTGWILITRSGSTGIVSTVPPEWDGYAMSEHVIRIVPKSGADVPPEYIQAVLRTAFCQDQLARGVFGSVIDEITPDFVSELELPVPKSRPLLKRIVDAVRAAEGARSDAVRQFTSAITDIDKRLRP